MSVRDLKVSEFRNLSYKHNLDFALTVRDPLPTTAQYEKMPFSGFLQMYLFMFFMSVLEITDYLTSTSFPWSISCMNRAIEGTHHNAMDGFENAGRELAYPNLASLVLSYSDGIFSG